MNKNATEAPAWVEDLLNKSIDRSFFTFRPKAIAKAVKCFRDNFTAKVLYAVKANPSVHVLRELIELGVNSFDVASLDEMRLVHTASSTAELFFMHPVKSRTAIRTAYFQYGIRHFSLDHESELRKILEETEHAKDLHLHVRIAIPNMFSEHSLADKFGIDMHEAVELLKKVSLFCKNIGICFHVGSQCMHPDAYAIAIRIAAKIMTLAKVDLQFFNVGGGFPSIYPGMHPPPLTEYFDRIHEEFTAIPNHENMQLLCEPGRALVAESASLIVRVHLRKQNTLYINNGTYGALFDAGTPKFIFPTRVLRQAKVKISNELQPFQLYGPTCDSLDYMPGPFYLPDDIKEGDYIEFGQMGAYGTSLATNFNGFMHAEEILEIDDDPIMSLYQQQPIEIADFQFIA